MRVKSALAGLAVVMVAGCTVGGGPVEAVDVIQKVQDAGYTCDRTNATLEDSMYNATPKVAYTWCNASAYTFYSEDQMNTPDGQSWRQFIFTTGQYGGTLYHDAKYPTSTAEGLSFPVWELMCADEACKIAAHKAGFVTNADEVSQTPS